MTNQFLTIAALRQLWRWFAMVLFVITLLYSSALFASNGMFKLNFSTPKDEVYRDIAEVYKASGQFQSIVEGINKEFILPHNIKIQFADKEGPLYDPNTRTITMSYGFIFYLTAVYLEKYPKADDESLIRFSIGSSTFLLYHEIAHAHPTNHLLHMSLWFGLKDQRAQPYPSQCHNHHSYIPAPK